MLPIIKIINSHFWKSFTGPFFAFGFPLIFTSLLGTLIGYDQVLGSLFLTSIMAVSLIVLPTALFEFKNSSLLKRIGVTPIKPMTFLITISLYYLAIMWIATITTMLISLAIFAGYWNEGKLISEQYQPNSGSPVMSELYTTPLSVVLASVEWGGFLWGMLMNTMISISIGLLISSVSKSAMTIQAIGIPILIICQFISPIVIPIGMLRDVDALWYFSYISPFKYSSGLVIESWGGNIKPNIMDSLYTFNTIPAQGPTNLQTLQQYIKPIKQNVFDVNSEFYSWFQEFKAVKMFTKADKIVNLVMPFVFTGLFSAAVVKNFKWSVK